TYLKLNMNCLKFPFHARVLDLDARVSDRDARLLPFDARLSARDARPRSPARDSCTTSNHSPLSNGRLLISSSDFVYDLTVHRIEICFCGGFKYILGDVSAFEFAVI